RTADHGLCGTEVVEQSDDLVGEGRHRVDERVGGPVGAAVTEQVERHHVQPDPVRARAVLGVLEPLLPRAAVEEELPDALGDQHGRNLVATDLGSRHPGSMATLHALAPDDWESFRDIRLRSLADSPDAFGSTWERERAFT